MIPSTRRELQLSISRHAAWEWAWQIARRQIIGALGFAALVYVAAFAWSVAQ